jgi:hypothetical protein
MYNTDQHQDGFCLFYYAADLMVNYLEFDIPVDKIDNRVKKSTNFSRIQICL